MAHTLMVGDIVEFTTICKLQNQYVYNVLHFAVTAVAGGSQTDAQFSTQMDAVVAPLYRGMLPPGNSYYGSKTQVIKAGRFDPVFNAVNRGAGTFLGAETLPTQIAAVANFKTGIASRSTRGRTYLPAATETDNQATGLPSAAYMALVDALFVAINGVTTIVTGGNSASISWGVYSRKLDVVFPITSVTVRSAWGTQRKRSQIGPGDAAPF